jgi:hypothetical protein
MHQQLAGLTATPKAEPLDAGASAAPGPGSCRSAGNPLEPSGPGFFRKDAGPLVNRQT